MWHSTLKIKCRWFSISLSCWWLEKRELCINFWVRAFYWLTISNWNDEVRRRKKKQFVSLHIFFLSFWIQLKLHNTPLYIHIKKKQREYGLTSWSDHKNFDSSKSKCLHEKVFVFTMRYNYRLIVFVRENWKHLAEGYFKYKIQRFWAISGELWCLGSLKVTLILKAFGVACHCGRFSALCASKQESYNQLIFILSRCE